MASWEYNHGPNGNSKNNVHTVKFRRLILEAHPSYPKGGTEALTKLLKENPKEFRKLQRKAKGRRAKRPARRAAARQPKSFVASDANLQAIIDAPERKTGRRGKRGKRNGKSTYAERKIQNAGNAWAESQGWLVAPGDKGGWPDNWYHRPGTDVRPIFVEWKQPGKVPSKLQAKKIQLLKALGYEVQVWSDVKSFKKWMRNR